MPETTEPKKTRTRSPLHKAMSVLNEATREANLLRNSKAIERLKEAHAKKTKELNEVTAKLEQAHQDLQGRLHKADQAVADARAAYEAELQKVT